MNKNDIFEIEITGMTDDGSGVGRAEGIAVFVPYTIAGETVRAIIVKVCKSYAYGKLMEVIKPSRHRVKSECEYFYKCGGCSLWHMDYEAELEFKEQKIRDCLKRIGGFDIETEPIIGCGDYKRYRNKAQFPVSGDKMGLYARRSHNVINMDDCLIQDKRCADVLDCVRNWMKKFNIEGYDEENGSGIVRHVFIRYGKSGGVVTIVTRTEEFPYADKLAKALLDLDADIIGLVQNVNEKNTNVILGDKCKTVSGTDIIEDAIGEFTFKVSPLSFYQVNSRQTEKLYEAARGYADLSGSEIVWDLYCGAGTIGQFMANEAKKIIGIEAVPEAVKNAEENTKINGIGNAEYYVGRAEEIAPSLVKKGLKPNVVILDPPRKGCDTRLLDAVVKSGSDRVVYVSCKPSTLARDLKYMSQRGYLLKSVTPVDMFPRTEHVETVCLLSRKAQ